LTVTVGAATRGLLNSLLDPELWYCDGARDWRAWWQERRGRSLDQLRAEARAFCKAAEARAEVEMQTLLKEYMQQRERECRD
jgi:hypothetical protein